MIREALEYLIGLADPKTEIVAENDDIKIIRRGKDLITVSMPIDPRDHAAGSLQALIDLAIAASDVHGPVVFYNSENVTAVLDYEESRRELVQFCLAPNGELQTLHGASGRWLDQKQFIRMLRIDLAGALPESVLLEKVRDVKFESGSIQTGKVTRKDESLGRNFSASSTSAEGDIPEEVELSVPIFAQHGERDRYPIRCAVDIDAVGMKFALIALPGAIEDASLMALNSIAKRLKDALPDTIPIYHGAP